MEAAARRLELLTASACTATSGAAAGVNGQAERWTISGSALGARDVVEQVTYRASAGTATLTFRTRVVC